MLKHPRHGVSSHETFVIGVEDRRKIHLLDNEVPYEMRGMPLGAWAVKDLVFNFDSCSRNGYGLKD